MLKNSTWVSPMEAEESPLKKSNPTKGESAGCSVLEYHLLRATEKSTPQVSDRLRGGTEKSTPQVSDRLRGGIELNDRLSGVRH